MANDDVQIVDLHAHFAMHLPLARRPCDTPADHLFNRALFAAANTFVNHRAKGVRASLARQGRVSFGSVLYHPADEIRGPCDPFDTLLGMLAEVEARLPQGWIARNFKDFSGRVRAGRNAVFHCIEGGFAIERPSQVPILRERGVAYVVLAHLLYRGISGNVNAFPFLDDRRYSALFAMPVAGLSEAGRDLCAALMDSGVLVDITHMTKTAASQVLDMAEARGVPVVASHAAPRSVSSPDYQLNLDEEILRRIARLGGVVGIIFFDHWLRPRGSKETGIDLVVRAIEAALEQAVRKPSPSGRISMVSSNLSKDSRTSAGSAH